MLKFQSKKYLKIANMSIKRIVTYRYGIAISVMATIVSIFILQKFWQVLYKNDVHQYTYMANYAVISQILGIIYNLKTPNKLLKNIKTGSISVELLRPWNYMLSLFFEDLGNIMGNILTGGIILYILSTVMFGLSMPSFGVFVMFFEAVFFAYILVFLIKSIVAMISFWIVEASSLLILSNIVINLLSGQFLPTWILPEWFEGKIQNLPFVWIYQRPIEIYLSDLNNQILMYDYVQVIVMQIAWILILSILAMIMWKKATKKLSIQGG